MQELLDDFSRTRALVVGDCMLDRYVRGHVAKISPEAPVPIVTMKGRQSCLGGAGNVAAGLSSLAAATELAGILGNDVDGAVVLELCRKAGIGTRSTIQTAATNTICKTRILADRGQQLLRLDEDGDIGAREQATEELSQAVLERLGEFNVVVLSDYEKGSLSPRLIRAVIDACKLLGTPVVVDPKKRDFSVYSGATLLTPNLGEMEQATGRRLSTVEAVRSIVQEYRTLWNLDYLLCTCGAEGMVWADERGSFHVPAEVRPVADVAGAGDTVVAVMAASIGAKRPVAEACQIASMAAGIAVSQRNVHVVAPDELLQAWRRNSPKILSAKEAGIQIEKLRRGGQRIVFTNGCFDILHAGHLACLEGAKRLGQILVVGLNSDASVCRLKGPTRPRINQQHRASLLAGLSCVDLVIVFEEDSPVELIQCLRPDVLVKGGDYDISSVVGAEIVRGYGGEVVVLPLVDGLSTTRILSSAGREFPDCRTGE